MPAGPSLEEPITSLCNFRQDSDPVELKEMFCILLSRMVAIKHV